MCSCIKRLTHYRAHMQAGAKHVYGIERSAIAEQARQIVEDNKYQDRITIIQGKVEEVELPVPQVPRSHDFILSPAERKCNPADSHLMVNRA